MADTTGAKPTKLKVGDPVFIRGNRMDRDETIAKAGRTKYTLSGGGKIDIAPHRLPDDGSRYMDFGRDAWLSRQAMDDAREKGVIEDRIRKAFSFGGAAVTLDQYRRIAAILDEAKP